MEGPRLPNPTVKFIDSEGNYLAVRLWCHIPRVGEIIDIDGWSGTVDVVFWRDSHVTIQVDKERV